MEKVQLKIVDKSGVISLSRLEILDLGSEITLNLYLDGIYISETGEFPFVVLNGVRKKLEAIDLKLICQGSRIDVHPSGMQLVGFFAYELELYKGATTSVYIFDDTILYDKIVTVKEQEAFFEKWLQSVRPDTNTYQDINIPGSTIGIYWGIISGDNWQYQRPDFQSGIIDVITEKLKKFRKLNEQDFLSVKNKFQEKLGAELNTDD